MMNRSLGIVCDELHIVHLESIMHEAICGFSVEQWVDMNNFTFENSQHTLNEPERQRLHILLYDIVEAIS